MDFCTNRHQRVRNGGHTSSTSVEHLNTPGLCASYHEEINNIAERTIYYFRKKEAKTHTPVNINGAEVEQVNGFRFLGISITKNLSGSSHISTLVKKAQKLLYFLRKLKKAKISSQILVNFYRGAIESILTGNITNCCGLCTAQDRRVLQRASKTTQDIIGTYLLSISDIGEVPAQNIKNIKRQHPPQQQPVYPAAIWQAIQKYLPYHQTTEQLLSSTHTNTPY